MSKANTAKLRKSPRKASPPQKRKKKRKVAAAVPASAQGTKMKVTAEMIGRARAKGTGTRPPVFIHMKAAPGTLPPNSNDLLANDEQIVAAGAWADQSLFAGMYEEGLTFLGYPYLSQLAQRAEYRRISETIATEMTRKWMQLQSSGDGGSGSDQNVRIQKIEDELKRMKVREAFREIALQDGFMGRAHLFLDFGDNNLASPELPTPIGDGRSDLSKAKISPAKPLRRVKVVEAMWCYPADYNSSNPLSPDWYNPQTWYVMGNKVHASRLLRFVGREVPDILKPTFQFGGLSLSQMAKPYVDNWLRTRQSVADLIHSFSVNVLSTDMGQQLMPGGGDGGAAGDALFRRIDLFNTLRDNRGTMAIDKDSEDWKNVSTPLGTLDMLQAQTQEHMAAVSGIPIIKLLGIQPAGLNASSEGEIRTYYDWIAAYQQSFFLDNLMRVIWVIQLSQFGDVDESIVPVFEELWSLDEKGKAEVEKVNAETDSVRIGDGIISPAEARAAIVRNPESPYAGLNPNEMPEPPEDAEEMEKFINGIVDPEQDDTDGEEPKPEPTAQAKVAAKIGAPA
ncbi:MAG: DUF1073 domain-containing protein [Alphaproteobacteria bacterium]|nr:DUF1073 domain-containing protein [Alphaproteobacteria bacterium]